MSNPLISIVLCTYNRADMLRDAMPSILKQSYEPVEILIVDDGSTDNTKEVVAGYGDNRIRYYRQDNKGLAAARTFACGQLARGEYIAFQDDDDIMPPHRITCLYDAMRLYPQAVLATGDWEMINVEGKLTGERITFDIEGKNDKPLLIEDGYRAVMWPMLTPLPNATLFRKTDGDRVGWLDIMFSRSSDTDFFGRLGNLGPVVYVPQVVAYYRSGHARMWSDDVNNSLVCEYSSFLLYEKHLKSLKNGRHEMQKRLQSRMLNTLTRLAFLARDCEKLPEAINADYVTRGLSLLGMKDRLSYEWYVNIKLPMRRLVKG